MPRRLPAAPFLYPIVDAAALRGRPAGPVVGALAAAGCELLQLRAKSLGDRAFYTLAAEAVAAAHRHGARLVINDRADIARMAGADGVHVGQDDLPPADVRRVLGPDTIVGFSTHDLAQLQRAAAEPIDYVAIGPVFPTRHKDNPDPVVGPEMVARARALAPQPLVAIGGITEATAALVVGAGAEGVAVIGALFDSDDVGAAAARMIAALRA